MKDCPWERSEKSLSWKIFEFHLAGWWEYQSQGFRKGNKIERRDSTCAGGRVFSKTWIFKTGQCSQWISASVSAWQEHKAPVAPGEETGGPAVTVTHGPPRHVKGTILFLWAFGNQKNVLGKRKRLWVFYFGVITLVVI